MTPDVTRSLTEVGVASAVGVMIAHAQRTERLHARGIRRAPLYGRSDWCGREAGWEALFVWDHPGLAWGVPSGDPWATLAAVAQATTRQRASEPESPRWPVAARGCSPTPWPASTNSAVAGRFKVPVSVWFAASANQTTHASAQNDWMRSSNSSLRCCLMRVSPAFPFGRAWTTIGRFEVALSGVSAGGDHVLIERCADAGVTWWLESIHGQHGSRSERLDRIRAGPPCCVDPPPQRLANGAVRIRRPPTGPFFEVGCRVRVPSQGIRD